MSIRLGLPETINLAQNQVHRSQRVRAFTPTLSCLALTHHPSVRPGPAGLTPQVTTPSLEVKNKTRTLSFLSAPIGPRRGREPRSLSQAVNTDE
jgi:hypothetical protein